MLSYHLKMLVRVFVYIDVKNNHLIFIEHVVKIKNTDVNSYEVSLDGGKTWSSVSGELVLQDGREVLKATINGIKSKVTVFNDETTLSVFHDVSC